VPWPHCYCQCPCLLVSCFQWRFGDHAGVSGRRWAHSSGIVTFCYNNASAFVSLVDLR
jgi:hypothetical protein